MREEGEGETRGREAEARKKLFPHLGPRLSERGKRSEVRAATFRVGWVAVNGLAISSFFPLLIFLLLSSHSRQSCPIEREEEYISL